MPLHGKGIKSEKFTHLERDKQAKMTLSDEPEQKDGADDRVKAVRMEQDENYKLGNVFFNLIAGCKEEMR